MIGTLNNFSVVNGNKNSALDMDIEKVVSQYTDLANAAIVDSPELDIIEEFQNNISKLYELNNRINFMNKEIGYVLSRRK